MTELDVEALKQRLGKKDLELAGKWPDDWPLSLEMPAGQWRAIIAALEDRDRLRAEVRQMLVLAPSIHEPDELVIAFRHQTGRRWWGPGGWPVVGKLLDRAALEGHNG